ncbi:ribosomal RNA-processing protein 8 isoform X1 [Linepithema humile]|uniref:ribosomal RNA-processing protein 8 isoform X1 n=2 Tax=Linepithema humile TaxID=83485 RepID=UPI00351EE3F9
MGKVKATSQQKKAPAIKNTQSIVKKRKKEKGKKGLLKNIHKSDLNKPNRSNEAARDIFTSIQNSKKKKHNFQNKHATKDMERSHTSTKYSKDNDKTKKIFQNVQTNTDNKGKYKKNKRLKQNINPTNNIKEANAKGKHKTKNERVKQNINQTNNIKETNVSKVKKDKELKIPAEKSEIGSKRTKIKIANVKMINRKILKKLSTKTEHASQNRDATSTKLTSTKVQQVEPTNILKFNDHRIKLNRLEQMFTNQSRTKQPAKILSLREVMMSELRASRFRFMNEFLYKNESTKSRLHFYNEPDDFIAYHEGYKQQLKRWPVDPLDSIISSIKKMPTHIVVADFGCGEARLASSVPHKVHSFDFIALNKNVQACDIADYIPLSENSVDVVVFCLSLMGTNLDKYIIQANRVLKMNGILKIAEVGSRFEKVIDFFKSMSKFGFKITWADEYGTALFYYMDFKKVADICMERREGFPPITLKPCLYKKR